MEDRYKSRRVIAKGSIASVFDDACIRRLAAIARLPQAGNMDCLAAGIRQAALLYARDAQEPSLNQLHNEIRQLHEAAQRGEYDQTAGLIETLTPPARDLLVERGQGAQHVVSLPTPAMLREPERRAEASQTVAMLLEWAVAMLRDADAHRANDHALGSHWLSDQRLVAIAGRGRPSVIL